MGANHNPLIFQDRRVTLLLCSIHNSIEDTVDQASDKFWEINIASENIFSNSMEASQWLASFVFSDFAISTFTSLLKHPQHHEDQEADKKHAGQ